MGLRKLQALELTTTGSDGSATDSATTTQPVNGWIVAVHLDYSASQAVTTDVTVTTLAPSQNVLVVSNNATDGWYYPKVQANAVADGSAISAEYHDGVPVDGYISVAVAGGDDGESVTVTLVVAE